MEAARLAVANFTSKRGHTTNVHESIRPAVTFETVKPTRHEIVQEAVDREVHQHHYHMTVQPLTHTETLPTRHAHNLIPVKHVSHEHDDLERTKARVASELAIFKSTLTTMPVVHTNAAMPAVVGEHYHHHVHEVVQPVLYKEVIAPEVVHTTMPIHETHHNEPVHHGISAMEMKLMTEFTKLGGVLTGSKSATHETYEGTPRPYLKELATTPEKLGLGASHRTPRTTTTTTTTSTTSSFSRRPAAIDTNTPQSHRTSGVTPTRSSGYTGHSRRSSVSSSEPSMPSTPTNQKYADPAIRTEGGMSPGMSPQRVSMDPQRVSMDSKHAHGGFMGRVRSRNSGAQPAPVAKY